MKQFRFSFFKNAFAFICFLVLFTVVKVSFPKSEILGKQTALATGGCKWHNVSCTNGKTRSTCVSDGDGTTCTCGETTRDC